MTTIILNFKFAILGACLKNASGNMTTAIRAKDVVEYSAWLERRTDLPVSNGFSSEQIARWLEKSEWFEKCADIYRTGIPLYRTNPQILGCQQPWPNLKLALIERLDPPLNYPPEIKAAAGLSEYRNALEMLPRFPQFP